MDFLIQLALELIIDGSIDSVSDKKTPMAVRVIAAIILIAAFCGLVGFSLFGFLHYTGRGISVSKRYVSCIARSTGSDDQEDASAMRISHPMNMQKTRCGYRDI